MMPELYDALFTETRTMAYAIRAKDEAEAREVARKLIQNQEFVKRLWSDLDGCESHFEVDTQASEEEKATLSSQEVDAYTRERDDVPVMMEVSLETYWGDDIITDVRTETFDARIVLDMYEMDELPGLDEELCDYDHIVADAMDLGLIPKWDGPFDLSFCASVGPVSPYELYLERRKAREAAKEPIMVAVDLREWNGYRDEYVKTVTFDARPVLDEYECEELWEADEEIWDYDTVVDDAIRLGVMRPWSGGFEPRYANRNARLAYGRYLEERRMREREESHGGRRA